MAGLCWMAVVLAFSLSAGNTEAMDLGYVTDTAAIILAKCFIDANQFSVAVNIPKNQDLDTLREISEECKYLITLIGQQDGLYKSSILVAATPKTTTATNGNRYTDHAEARVLDNIEPLADSSEGKSLFFYSYLSPCGAKCTNPNKNNNILKKIDNIPNDRWADSAFVFSNVFDGYTDQNGKYVYFSEGEIRNTLINLGQTKFGSDNIFRCSFSSTGQIRCIECFINGSTEPVDGCVKN
ncbi:uncharacterized protein LOC114548619 [Perca flavescens]|uniref:uncharacterized protein LOC114548619 n=1 Tax=Perca flavescens TaxID=8167 RepID=UPI00106EDD04|nr:uncharacterized protein LOC114548619 [Perca flavescens]